MPPPASKDGLLRDTRAAAQASGAATWENQRDAIIMLGGAETNGVYGHLAGLSAWRAGAPPSPPPRALSPGERGVARAAGREKRARRRHRSRLLCNLFAHLLARAQLRHSLGSSLSASSHSISSLAEGGGAGVLRASGLARLRCTVAPVHSANNGWC